MVDGHNIKVAFSKRSTKGTPELVIRLWHGYTSTMGPTLPFIPQVLYCGYVCIDKWKLTHKEKFRETSVRSHPCDQTIHTNKRSEDGTCNSYTYRKKITIMQIHYFPQCE